MPSLGLQAGQKVPQAVGGIAGLAGQVLRLGFFKIVPQTLKHLRVLADQQLHRKVQGIQGTGEGPKLGLVQLQSHHLHHRQLHAVQPHRAVLLQVGEHEEKRQRGRRLGFRRPFGWFNGFGSNGFGVAGRGGFAESGQFLQAWKFRFHVVLLLSISMDRGGLR